MIFPNEKDVHEIYKRALLMKESLETKLFNDEKPNSHDVYKGQFPDEDSLVGDAGDFLLFRYTGSLIYIQLRRALVRDLKAVSDQLSVKTAEKAAYLWMVSIQEWIEALSAAIRTDSESQLVITVDNACRLLTQGRDVLYSVADEVQDTLAIKQVKIRCKPEKYSIVINKGGAMNSPGGSLLRWAALLFEGLRADVKKESAWRAKAESLVNSFPQYEQLGGKNISLYIEQINGLLDKSKEMFVRDARLVGHLVHIVDHIMKSETLKRRLDDELAAAEKEKFDREMAKYEGPPLVEERFNLLDGLMIRTSCAFATEDEVAELTTNDIDELFAGEQGFRDKSR